VKYAIKFTVFSISICSTRHCHITQSACENQQSIAYPEWRQNSGSVMSSCPAFLRDEVLNSLHKLYVADYISVRVMTPALRNEVTCNILIRHCCEETFVCGDWETLKPKNGVCCLRWKKRPLTCDTAPTASLFLGFLGVGGGSWHTPLGGHVTRAAINPSTPAREGRYQPHSASCFSQPYSDVLREPDYKVV